MIQGMIFDLDGTLLQTERLKAISYARAAVELCPDKLSEGEVIAAFKEVVGLSRQEVAAALMQRFGLEEVAKARMAEFGVKAPWQAFVQVRLHIYEAMIADPAVLRDNQWPHNVVLLRKARQDGHRIGLATMSHCAQVQYVLQTLNWSDAFDFVASRDDVEHGKPDPEIYLLVASGLDIPPGQCLVIEDSPVGVRSALAAGMRCIAVTTPFTREAIHAAGMLDEAWVVDDPNALAAVVERMVAEWG